MAFREVRHFALAFGSEVDAVGVVAGFPVADELYPLAGVVVSEGSDGSEDVAGGFGGGSDEVADLDDGEVVGDFVCGGVDAEAFEHPEEGFAVAADVADDGYSRGVGLWLVGHLLGRTHSSPVAMVWSWWYPAMPSR